MITLTRRFCYLLLALIGLITYQNCFSNSFVWDDEILIVANGYIKSLANLFKIFTVDIYHWTTESNFYRPLFSLSLMLDYRLWRLDPFGYHLTNFFLHLLNTFLVFYLIGFLTQRLKTAFIASLLYLVHPVHTQAVTYISGRADLLAAFFVLGSVLCFAKSADTGSKKNLLYFISIILFVFSLLSKEIALALPFILIAYDYCFGGKSQNLKRHIVFLSLALIYVVLRDKFLPFTCEGMLGQSLFVRMINLPRIIIFYLWLLIFPWNLHIERSFPLSEFFGPSVILSIFLLLVILGWSIKIRNQKILLFSCLWFLINLLPVTNIILPLNAVVAEHWLYIPSIGFFIILALGFEKIPRLSYQFKMTVIIIIITTLGLLTIARNFEWRNAVILFEATLKSANAEENPRDIRAHFNLGTAYLNKGSYDKAIGEFNEALKGLAFPRCKRAHYHLAIAYIGKSLYKESEGELLKAIEADPKYVSAYYLLGTLYKKMGDTQRVKEVWNKLLKIESAHPYEEIFLKKANELLDR